MYVSKPEISELVETSRMRSKLSVQSTHCVGSVHETELLDVCGSPTGILSDTG